VRGSSSKEKINLNKKLIIFILHGDKLWAWYTKKGLELIEDNVSDLKYGNDDDLYYKVDYPENQIAEFKYRSKIKRIQT